MRASSDRGAPDAEQPGNIVVVEVAEIPQHEYLPVGFGQLRQRLVEFTVKMIDLDLDVDATLDRRITNHPQVTMM